MLKPTQDKEAKEYIIKDILERMSKTEPPCYECHNFCGDTGLCEINGLPEGTFSGCAQDHEFAVGWVNSIMIYLEKKGYHIGLPSHIEEALNSGDGTYRP